jgi:fatty-acyl-CoA synthase
MGSTVNVGGSGSAASTALGSADHPLLEETIGANLERTVRAHGDRTAFVSCHQGVRYTYAEFDAAVDDLAVSLLGLGLEPGDRVGIWSPNHVEWALVQYATAKIGVVLVNVNPAYRTHELTYALQQSGCRVLVAAPSFKTSDYVDMVASVRADVPQLERAVFFWSDEWDSLRTPADAAGRDRLRALSASLRPDDPINIQYTSGTTGFPKGATLSHRNILNNGYFVAEGLRYTEHDTVCVPVPLYHCFGMVMGNLGATTHGACVVYPEAAFDAAATLRALEAERCTSLFGVPTMFIAELAALASPEFAGLDLSTMRTGLMAGSPCPVEVMKQVTSTMHMPEVGIAYGMTETSPVSTQTATDDTLDRRCGTVGRAAPPL